MIFLTFFIVLFSYVSLIYPMDPAMAPPVQRKYPLALEPMKFKDDPDIVVKINPNPIELAQEKSSTFDNMQVNDLDTIFQSASRKVKFLHDWLTDEKLRGMLDFPYFFFVGPHGSGKTTLAKALAYKVCSNSSWQYEYVSSRAFMGKYRNHTGVCLRSYLEKISELKKPTLVIIDQLNKILEYTKSSSDDTWFASDLICDFMDRSEHNNNLLFLGIMDRVSKLDDRLKSRMMCHCYFFTKPIPLDHERIIFTSKLVSNAYTLDQEVTDTWLSEFLKSHPEIRGPNYRGLALEIIQELESEQNNSAQNNEHKLTITKAHIESALKKYIEKKKHIYNPDPYENYTDKTERLHTEGLFQKFLENGQLQLLEIMLETKKPFFLADQIIILRKLLELHK